MAFTPQDHINALTASHGFAYSTRARCLDFLFFVTGSGYEWFNGRLAHTFEDEVYAYYLACSKRDELNYEGAVELADDDVAENMPDFLEDWRKERTDERLFAYQFSDRALICQVPDDVKDSWLAVVFEALERVIDLRRTRYPVEYEKHKQMGRTIERCDDLRCLLIERFGSPRYRRIRPDWSKPEPPYYLDDRAARDRKLQASSSNPDVIAATDDIIDELHSKRNDRDHGRD